MILYHLNEAQRAFLRQWLEDNPTRPSFGAYDSASRTISKIPVTRKPSAKSLPHTVPGFGAQECVPLKSFDAIKHLPPGWAIISTHDSGNNHAFDNAGSSLMRALWNCWSRKSGTPVNFTTPLGSKLQRQLLANDITFP